MPVHERASSPGKGLPSLCPKADEATPASIGPRAKSSQSPDEAEDEIGSAEWAASDIECGNCSGSLVRADGSSGDRFRVGRNREPSRQRTGAAVTPNPVSPGS